MIATTPLSSLSTLPGGRTATPTTATTSSKTPSRKVPTTSSNVRRQLTAAVAAATPSVAPKQKRKDIVTAAAATLSNEESSDAEDKVVTKVPKSTKSKKKAAVAAVSDHISSEDDNDDGDADATTKSGKLFYSQKFSSSAVAAVGQPPIIRSSLSSSQLLLVPLSLKIEKPPQPQSHNHPNNHHLHPCQPQHILNNNQQQQLLGSTDRMSKEKQKFFRHSAFNSDRVIKVSPPSPVSPAISARGIAVGGNGSSTTSISDRLSVSTHNNDVVLPPPPPPPANLQINEANLSETSTSCSSSDDEDGSSSDSSTSSSDDSNSSSSSNSSSTNDADASTNKPAVETVTAAPPPPITTGWSNGIFSNDSKQASPANSKFAVIQQQKEIAASNAFRSATSTLMNGSSNSWGFAAEAKKSVDIFRKAPPANERVFGNFDGIDKESLVKIDPLTSAAAATNTTEASASSAKPSSDSMKTTGHLKGLFDSLTHVFSTTDFSRSRLGVPNYKSDRRKDRAATTSVPKVILKETRSTYKDYKQQRFQEQNRINAAAATPSSSSRLLLNPLNKNEFNRFLHPAINSFSAITRNSRPVAAAVSSNPEQFAKRYFTNKSISNNGLTMSSSSSSFSTQQNRRFTLPDATKHHQRRYHLYDDDDDDDTSSDDDDDEAKAPPPPAAAPRLTPSNLVKNAINGQDHRTALTIPTPKDYTNNHKLFGAIGAESSASSNTSAQLLRDSGGVGGVSNESELLCDVSAGSTSTAHCNKYQVQPQFSQSQLMGKRE